MRGSEAIAKKDQSTADQSSIAVARQGVLGSQPGGKLRLGLLDAALSQVAVTEIQMKTRSQRARRRDSDGSEVHVLNEGVCRYGELVPCDLLREIVLQVGEVVSDHAALRVVALVGPVPAGCQLVKASIPVASQEPVAF